MQTFTYTKDIFHSKKPFKGQIIGKKDSLKELQWKTGEDVVSQIRNIRFDVVSIKKKLLALEKAIFRRILHQPESLMLFLKKSIVAPLLKNLFLPLLSRYRILLANIRFLMETLNRSFHCGRNTSYHESTGSQ